MSAPTMTAPIMTSATMTPLNRRQMAWRAAQDIGDRLLVNLGLGMPLLVADYLTPGIDVFIQSENGVVGAGPLAAPDAAPTGAAGRG